jgi:hypothetical protein
MAEGLPDITQELDDKTSQPMDFKLVLMRQVDRILASMTKGEGDYISGVEGLQAVLSNFYQKNKRFQDAIDEIERMAQEEANKHKLADGKIPGDKVQVIASARAKLIFKELMILLGEAGFYPEQQTDWVQPV